MKEVLIEQKKQIAEKVDAVLKKILDGRPALQAIAEARTLGEYLEPPLRWNPEKGAFPLRPLLEDLILKEAERLYGIPTREALREEFSKNWAVETGAHIYLPRRYDRLEKKGAGQINPVVFQGQVLWAALRRALLGSRINFSMNTGRIPLCNANSGAYLDFSFSTEPLRLVSNRYMNTPQLFIPALDDEKLKEKTEQLQALASQEKITDAEYAYAKEVLAVFVEHRDGRFNHQVAVGQAHIMNKVLPQGMRQVTIDLENIGTAFIVRLLRDPSSTLYRIFSDEKLRARFYGALKGIRTAWEEGDSMFYEVDRSGKELKLREYRGDLMPEVLADLLESERILHKGLLGFYIFIIEGGLCPIGGMFQSQYCIELRDRMIPILEAIGEEARAAHLQEMPTAVAATSPCWGLVRRGAGVELLIAMDCMAVPLSEADFAKIPALSGRDSLRLAAPSLAQLMLHEEAGVTYEELRELLGEHIVTRGMSTAT
ncbi:MAG: hypothetical protein HYW65_02995 [Candidatus Liptonbacteria bacterium]|nr:hypothetical protein [Candidatus Liptonbacteria bacterium]